MTTITLDQYPAPLWRRYAYRGRRFRRQPSRLAAWLAVQSNQDAIAAGTLAVAASFALALLTSIL